MSVATADGPGETWSEPAGDEAPPSGDAAFAHLCRGLPRLFEELRIAVIYNGNNSEPGAVIHPTYNPRSTKSYEPVARDIAGGLKNAGFRHVSVMPDDMRMGDRLRADAIDFAWVNSAGVQGYGAACHTAATLEMLGIPYVGHNPLNAGTLDNKHAFKRGLTSVGVRTAPFVVWDGTRGTFDPERNALFESTFAGHSGRFVVKPVSGRASQYVYVVDRVSDLPDAVRTVYEATHNAVLVESYLPGREFCVAIYGRVAAPGGQPVRHGAPFAFSAVERVLGRDEPIFTSMDLRPITRDRTRLLDQDGDRAVTAALAEVARQVYLDFQLRGLIRLDLRADADGLLHVLEANPKPDMKRPSAGETSLVSIGLEAIGMTYDNLTLGMMLDRIDFYQRHRQRCISHIPLFKA